MTLYAYGGTPDSYVEDRGTASRIPGIELVILDAVSGDPVTGLRDADGSPAASVTTDADGYYAFSCDDSASVLIEVTDSLGTAQWGPISSPVAVRDAVEAVPAITAQASAATSAAAAATATAETAQGTAETALGVATTHTHGAADITSGTVAPARLGSGSPSASTFLRGDSTWATPSGGGGGGLPGGWVSVTAHGATGNGATDDRAAIIAARDAAGPGGVVWFPPGVYGLSSPVQPLERQIWQGCHSPLYEWDETPASTCALKALSGFSGSALIHLATPSSARGVTVRNLAFIGRGDTTGSLNGIDFGPSGSGGERAWMVDQCQFLLFAGAALAGHMWVVDVRDSHISRCGYGIRPSSGAGGSSCVVFDNRWIGLQIYFCFRGGIRLDNAAQSGQILIAASRVERSGTQVSGSTMDPNANRDQNAAGIYLASATGVQIIGVSTDANAGPGLQIEGASANAVNNVNCAGNLWKRDGTGNNTDSTVAGVRVHNAQRISFHGDRITWGDPNDSGSGRAAPQVGLELSASNYVTWDGHIELETGTLTASAGVTTSSVTDSVIRESGRMRRTDLPHGTTANRPTVGAAFRGVYFDDTLGKPVFWNGTGWVDAAGTAA